MSSSNHNFGVTRIADASIVFRCIASSRIGNILADASATVAFQAIIDIHTFLYDIKLAVSRAQTNENDVSTPLEVVNPCRISRLAGVHR